MDKPIQDAVIITEQFQENINRLLSEPRYNGNLVNINANIRMIKNKLAFMGGKLTALGRNPNQVQGARKHGPLKKFMGKPLEVINKVETTAEVKKSLTPSQNEKDVYKKKVAKLMGEISKFPPQSILTNYRREDDIMTVRGVAYKLGIEDADKREMNIQFITEIIEAINKKKEDGSLQVEIDQAAEDDKTAALAIKAAEENERSQILTAEDIAADPWLQKKGARPGDQLVWDEKSRKKIIPGGTEPEKPDPKKEK